MQQYLSHRVFLQPSLMMECFTNLSIFLRKENVILLGFAPINKREINIIVDPLNLEAKQVRGLINKALDSLDNSFMN